MASNPKYNLPNFRRISSQHSASDSFANDSNSHNVSQNTHINTTRTVSSLSSMISTPSNNIRRFQNGNHLQNHHERKPISQKPPNINVKKKLLNLHQLLKLRFADPGGPRSFVLRQPANMNMYDYSVFIKHCDPESEVLKSLAPNDQYIGSSLGDEETECLPPPIRESQIKAWESAEKISSNLIFDSSDDEVELDDNYDAANESIDDKENLPHLKEKDDNIILALPGYTRGDVAVILAHFRQLQKSLDPIDYTLNEEMVQSRLWEARQQHQSQQERAFAAYQTLPGKRKIQVTQKKELLHRMFGYTNSVNLEHVTNNTSYLAVDNVLNTQKAFHEDKDEINALLEEDKAYNKALAIARKQLHQMQNPLVDATAAKAKRADISAGFDYDKFAHLTGAQLDRIYDAILDGVEVQEDDDDELPAFTLGFLKRCLKEEDSDREE